MSFVKCPRCDLNYMQDTEQYCAVCRREMKGDESEELFEMCSVCGENPVLPGKELCLFCQKELGKSQEAVLDEEKTVADESALELDSTSNMDEIAMDDIDSDIPQNEYGEISRELSLSKAIEEEEELADEDEEDDL